MSTELVTQGIAAFRAGDRAKARQLLQNAVQQDPHDEMAWLWLAGAVETDMERAACLESALEINPNNVAAQKALDKLKAALPPAPTLPPESPRPAAEPSLKQEIQRRPKRKKRLLLPCIMVILAVLIFVGGAVGVGGWYYFYGPCGKVLADRAMNRLIDIHGRWLDAINLASSTSRIAISGPISNLQSIRQEAQNLKVPSCMQDAKASLVESMNNAIDGFLAFAQQKSDSTVQAYFTTAGDNIDTYADRILEVRKCVPLCYLK